MFAKFLPAALLRRGFARRDARSCGPSQPEPPSGWTDKKAVTARKHVVVAAHPLAAEAGRRMLDKGGSAVDAAIATQLVLGLVEPHASGLGGGAFLLVHDAKAKRTLAYDGRETAPSGAEPQLFIGADGKPMPFQAAVVGGKSVGVPGTLRLLEVAHARHGRLAWAALFQPAIEIAEKGFAMSPRLFELVGKDASLAREPATRAYFLGPDGKPWPIGTVNEEPGLCRHTPGDREEGFRRVLHGRDRRRHRGRRARPPQCRLDDARGPRRLPRP